MGPSGECAKPWRRRRPLASSAGQGSASALLIVCLVIGLPARLALRRVVLADQHVGRGVVAGPEPLAGDLDPAQPLDARAADPAGREGAQGEAVVLRQDLAVERPGEQRVGVHRLLRGEDAAEASLRRGLVEADEQHAGGVPADPRQLQHVAQGRPQPDAVADAPRPPLRPVRRAPLHPLEHRALVPRAFEVGNERAAGQGAHLVVGQLQRAPDGVAADAQPPVPGVHVDAAEGVVAHEKEPRGGDHPLHALEAGLEALPAVPQERPRVLEPGRGRALVGHARASGGGGPPRYNPCSATTSVS